jgi:hypothetical protein
LVVGHDRGGIVDTQAAQRILKPRRSGEGMATPDPGRVGEIDVEIDEPGPGEVSLGIQLPAGAAAQLPLDVEEDDVRLASGQQGGEAVGVHERRHCVIQSPRWDNRAVMTPLAPFVPPAPAPPKIGPAILPPLRLGPLEIASPVVLAPMAGITNRAFRRLCRESVRAAGASGAQQRCTSTRW